MLKNFIEIEQKPELIRILFVTSLDLVDSRVNTNWRSRQKNPELLPESWKLNGNIFIKLFLGDLDEKMTSASFKRERTKNTSETVWRADNLFNLGLRHVQVIKANTSR